RRQCSCRHTGVSAARSDGGVRSVPSSELAERSSTRASRFAMLQSWIREVSSHPAHIAMNPPGAGSTTVEYPPAYVVAFAVPSIQTVVGVAVTADPSNVV